MNHMEGIPVCVLAENSISALCYPPRAFSTVPPIHSTVLKKKNNLQSVLRLPPTFAIQPISYSLVAQCSFLSALRLEASWPFTFSCSSFKANMCQSRWEDLAQGTQQPRQISSAEIETFLSKCYLPLFPSYEHPVRSHCTPPPLLSTVPNTSKPAMDRAAV